MEEVQSPSSQHARAPVGVNRSPPNLGGKGNLLDMLLAAVDACNEQQCAREPPPTIAARPPPPSAAVSVPPVPPPSNHRSSMGNLRPIRLDVVSPASPPIVIEMARSPAFSRGAEEMQGSSEYTHKDAPACKRQKPQHQQDFSFPPHLPKTSQIAPPNRCSSPDAETILLDALVASLLKQSAAIQKSATSTAAVNTNAATFESLFGGTTVAPVSSTYSPASLSTSRPTHAPVRATTPTIQKTPSSSSPPKDGPVPLMTAKFLLYNFAKNLGWRIVDDINLVPR